MSSAPLRSGASAALAIAIAVTGALGAAPASAIGPDTTFACDTPLGKKDMKSQSDTDFPEVMHVGDAPVSATYTGKVTVPSDLMSTAYDLLGARSVEGYSDQTLSVNGVARTFRVTAPNTAIVKGQPLVMNGVGDFGTIEVPTTPTLLKITSGNTYKSHMKILKGNGSVASESDSTCVSQGAGAVVDTIRVMARSTTAMTMASTTVAEGEPVEVAAEVTVSGGAAAGSVKFTSGDQSVTAPVTEGRAEGLLPALPTGEHPVTAQFLPNDAQLYESSSSAPTTLSVVSVADAVATTTTLELTPSSAEVGTPIDLRATVTAADSAPTGKVRFQVGSKLLSADLADGVASARATDLPVGTHPVTATFVPTRVVDFRSSRSAAKELTITPEPAPPGSPTTITVPEFTSPVVHGRAVAVSAYVVAESGAMPTGLVRFEVGGYVRNVPVSFGRATASFPPLPIGSHQVKATFVPRDEAFRPSTATARVLRVESAPVPQTPAVNLTFPRSAPQAKIGFPVSARIADESMAGSVRFSVGSISRTARVEDGVARVRFPGLKAGQHRLTARFTPQSAQLQQRSVTRSIRVVKARTTSSPALRRVSAQRVAAVVVVRTASSASRCATRATMTLTRGDRTLARRHVRVPCSGKVQVMFTGAKVKARGIYRLAVVYSGNSMLTTSKARVTKRL